MLSLYIDIDGVLLTSHHTQPAPGAVELIDYVTQHFDCYWLTSYCRGDARPVLKLLSKYFDKHTMSKFQSVHPTQWHNHKGEAIDVESDFYWLDDNPSRAAIQMLKDHECLDRLIVVDVNREDELKGIAEYLSQRHQASKHHKEEYL